MSSSREEAVTIVVDGPVRVSGLLQRPLRPRTCYVVAHGAGAGNSGRRGTCRARSCDFAFPVPVHGAGWQTTRPAQAGSGHNPCRGGRGCQNPCPASPHCRRQVVWWPDDVASSGHSSPSGRPWTRISRVSVSVRGLAFLGFPLHPAGHPCRRQVVWWPDDVASSGHSSPSGRPWTRISRVSVAPGGTSIARSRPASN